MEKLDVDDDEYREPIPGEYGNPIPRELFFRELGFANRLSRFNVGNRAVSTTLATKAVHTLATKENFNRRKFKLPLGARTTFHMAFSPDGTKVASCHGDHNIYVCDVRSGEVLQTLTGHPRTPWCVVFHPTQNDVLASGCLAGHIRVWDLNGGSEVLVTDSGTVIASLAFHPTVRLLVIATFNEIMFWDWNLPYPLARCSTENPKEKVRLVRFDRLGKNLITGITNYPHPPTREGLSNTAGANHRPNILTRNNAGPSGNVQDYVGGRNSDIPPRESNFQALGAGQARSNRQPGSAHAGAGMAHLAASLAAAAEAEATSAVLNRRQDRFQESYRQLVNHYQDLVTHYQQFLRSRIPRLLETSRLVRDQPGAPTSSEPPVAPVSDPAEVTHPLENFSDVPGPGRLAQIERRLQEIMNNPEVSASLQRSRANAGSASTSAGGSTAVPGPSRLRNDSDLRNIEMLAQNILEMQNLCSQARRDAPLTIETQHIIELQNIRRHLEMLQEQTRDLQSSIRATLTSLARNSLDALRSQVDVSSPAPSALNPGRGRLNLDILRGSGSSQTGPLNTQPPLYYSNNASSNTNSVATAGESGNASATANPSNAILRITIGPRLSASAEIIPPSTSASASNSANNNHSQPSSGATTMHYEIPIPVTSRQTSNSNAGGVGDRGPANVRRLGSSNGEPPMRRVTHEYYIGARREHLMEQHARNCPFNSRDQMVRPPPRLRCLSEMGQTLNLTVWPTMDSDNCQDNSQITAVSRNRRRNASDSATSILRIRGQENAVLSSISALVVPHQVFAGRLNWISNDIGVHMQLLMRQLATRNRSTSGYAGPSPDEDCENWQRCFMGGYALVPQSSRRGERPEVDLQRVSMQGSATPAPSRQNPRITYREDGTVVLNLRNPPVSSSASTSSATNAQPGASGDASITTAQSLPPQLPGGFSMVYRMRIGDEVIPVFTSPDNAVASFSTHVLEGPLPNVFVLPIGLFLRGVSWENNTESIGIYWPPLTRDEEENLISISNRSSELVRVYAASFRNTHMQESENQIARHRVTYDNNQLCISVSDGTFITFVQPGLLLLDLISSMSALPRPRPLQGVVYVNYVSSVLFAVERLFANRPTSASFSSVGASNGNPSRFSFAGSRLARNPYRSPQPLSRSWIGSHPMSNSDSGSRAPDSPSAAFSFTLAEPRIHLERVDQMLLDRRRRIVQAINEENANRANSSAMNVNGATAGPSTRYRLQSASAASGNIPVVSESASTEGRASPGPRRIIRLAVDAATGEIRREPPYTRSNVDLTRAIESRIERVLNERGNRGIDINSSSFLSNTNQNSSTGGPERGTNGLDEAARERQVRLEDIQLRICMLAQWPSRQVSSVSSATQTVGSNEGEASNSSTRDMSTNTTVSTITEPRYSTSNGTSLAREGSARSTATFLRRRTAPDDNLPDEYSPSPSRRPRLDRPVIPEDNSQQASLNDGIPGNDGLLQSSSVPINVTPNDTYLSRLRSALRSHWERNARHMIRPYGSPTEHGNHNQSRTESRLPSNISATDLNRPYSNIRAVQSNSTYTSTVQSNQLPRVAVPPLFNTVPQNVTSESSTRSQTTPMTSGEPILFQLPDFFAPLEVSRVENSVDASGSSRDFESGRLQESHLILEPSMDSVPQPQADRSDNTISSPVYDSEMRPEFGSEGNSISPDDDQVIENRRELPYQRLRQALASANSVLERIGEAAVRETISALNSENNITDVPVPLEEINVPAVSSYVDPAGTPEITYLRDPRLPFSPPPVVETDAGIGVSSIDEATARNAANAVGDFLHLQEAPEPQVVLPFIDPIHPSEIDPSELLRIPSIVNDETSRPIPEVPPTAEPGTRPGRQPSRNVSEWYLRRRAPMTQARIRVTFRSGNSHDLNPSAASGELSGSARTRIGINVTSASASHARPPSSSHASTAGDGRESYHRRRPPQYGPENISPYLRFVHNYAGSAGGTEDGLPPEAGARYYPGYIPEILISPRARSQTYYTMDAATTAFLSSRIQKWDFSGFCIPDITDRTFGLITSSCSLLSDSTLDVSSDSEFIAVLQPSDNGSYSAVGIYSLRDETLGESLYTYHFDQNTVSVSISPSCDYIVVGYAGRGAFYRIIHPSRHIGQILSLTRDGPQLKLVPVKDLYADTQPALMSVNCMQWVPVPGYGIVYGTNTGEVVLLS